MKAGVLPKMIASVLCLAGVGSLAFAATATINLATKHQKISGFGASTAWASNMSATDADLLWSTTTGAGLSLHRIRIDPNQGTSETAIAKLAVARGVTVWATPWTPASSMKAGEKKTNVGGLLVQHQTYADKLLAFTKNMKNNGVPIYAVSAQNEPDANVDYESCDINPDSMVLWVGKYLGPTFAGSGVKIMSPESQNWWGIANYWPKLKASADVMKYTDIVATHEYGGTIKAYPDIQQAGKEFWQTEIYDTQGPADAGMGSGLRTAKLIHEALTIAYMNAWHFWWVYPTVSDNGALWDKDSGKPSKRLWVMGNFSRFVRPGDIRVDATVAPTAGVTLTAYTDLAATKIVVVAINTNASATSQAFSIAGATPSKVTPWVTDATQNLVAQTAQTLSSNDFSYSLPAKSVTTLVFQIGNAVPTSSSAIVASSASVAQGPYSTAAAIPGTIQMENYDVGGEGVAYHDADATNSGNIYRTDGVDITGDATLGYKIGWTEAEEWLEYTVNVASAGSYMWEAKVSMGGDSAAFHMSIDGTDITDRVQILGAGSWDTYSKITGNTKTPLTAGSHVLRVTFDRSYANIDEISFSGSLALLSQKAKLFSSSRAPILVYNLLGNKVGEVWANNEAQLRNRIQKELRATGVFIAKSGNASMRIVVPENR